MEKLTCVNLTAINPKQTVSDEQGHVQTLTQNHLAHHLKPPDCSALLWF